MGNAWTGAKTDIAHNVWMACMDDAQMGAMTDVTHDVWMGCTDDARTGATTDVSHELRMGGDFTGFSCREFTTFSSP